MVLPQATSQNRHPLPALLQLLLQLCFLLSCFIFGDHMWLHSEIIPSGTGSPCETSLLLTLERRHLLGARGWDNKEALL